MTLIDRSSFYFARTLDLSSMSFVLIEGSLVATSIRKTVITTVGTRLGQKPLGHPEVVHTTHT